MGHVRLSGRLSSAPQILAAGLEATGLYVRGLTYCARNRTDGCVPVGWVSEQPRGRRLALRLVEAGLWEGAGADGWRITQDELLPLAKIHYTRSRHIPQWLRRAVFVRDEGVCQLCLKPIDPDEGFHADHVLPASLGGPTQLDNLQLAHPFCNISKGNRVVAL